jgi:hypothetical protein
MKVIYVVYEEDRGLGTQLIAGFINKNKADVLANDNSHYYVQPVMIQDAAPEPYKG